MKDILIISDRDLDGVSSMASLLWGMGLTYYDVDFVDTIVSELEDFVTHKLSKIPIEKYKKVFVLDLDVSKVYQHFDHSNFVIIDHHSSHEIGGYKNAKLLVEIYPSCAALIYKHFKEYNRYTPQQKKLIALANDYDCYELKYPESYDLNITWKRQLNEPGQNKFEAFWQRWEYGFDQFNKKETAIIHLERIEIDKTIKNLKLFQHKKLLDKGIKLFSTHIDNYTNEVSQYLFDEYGADIVCVFNNKHKSISFRKNRHSEVGLSALSLAEGLCEGGGHEFAAGGKVTDKFIKFTKDLITFQK